MEYETGEEAIKKREARKDAGKNRVKVEKRPSENMIENIREDKTDTAERSGRRQGGEKRSGEGRTADESKWGKITREQRTPCE